LICCKRFCICRRLHYNSQVSVLKTKAQNHVNFFLKQTVLIPGTVSECTTLESGALFLEASHFATFKYVPKCQAGMSFRATFPTFVLQLWGYSDIIFHVFRILLFLLESSTVSRELCISTAKTGLIWSLSQSCNRHTKYLYFKTLVDIKFRSFITVLGTWFIFKPIVEITSRLIYRKKKTAEY
jgi:hypothetical protein